ncbi:phosphatidylinositol phosphate synthase [Aestuariimicrobium ganziense]|uniref:phosphatidylinositol phosphate synthase n=1 Tax=Aestuariimicrobium ganziense TaxID=2773677 RepID=UPI00194547DC|nr:CDP-alcohol phosphatidyltransferase family protein [Aestuariimicrobium ganziense]
MLEQFRGLWTKLMTPPARLFIALKVHPDAITWAGTLITVVTAMVFLPRGWLWQGAALLLVFMLSDGIDGQMARMTNRVSTWGAFLDSSLDRIGDGAVFGAVVLYYAGRGDSVLWAGIALGALVMGQVTSYVKARGEALDMKVVGGLAARADRVLVLLLGLALAGVGLFWALPVALCWLLLASTITVGQRMAQVHRQAEARDAAV